MFYTGKSAEEIVKGKELDQISDTADLERIIKSVLDINPQSVSDYAVGKTQAAGFLMGQIMKASKGKANPQVAKAILDSYLRNKY